MLMAISFLFTGCQSKTPVVNSNSAQSNSEQEPPLEIAYTVEPVAFQENIPLQKTGRDYYIRCNRKFYSFFGVCKQC